MGTSQTIGPYILEKRLGAGGMGEVYQAYDSRLERRVAIKLIRPEQTESETARERFRREARAAAGLSHPSIVQIHDIVEGGESDAIVMELVDGERLSQWIARGPLPVGEAVRIGREIAEGLAAAHAKGLIHRDLKPENVMINGEGRAKILDFGLAKRLAGEASLTADHRVLGTFRAMSPEQAKGMPLDARSDLFSFGLLLYEMLSGRSPFEGSSTLDTLTRICTHRQAPLREIGAVPEGLSDLVDQLLEKDSARRPQSAREVASALETLGTGAVDSGATWVEGRIPRTVSRSSMAGPSPVRERTSQVYPAGKRVLRWGIVIALLAVLAATLLWQLKRREPAPAPKPESPVRVVVRKPEIGAGAGEDAQLVASSLRISLLRSLLGFSGISPLTEGDDVAGSPVQVARALAVQEILTSRLDCLREGCQVSLQRVRGSDGETLWSSRSFSVDKDRLYLVEEAVRGYLADAYPGFARRPGAASLAVRPADYTQYLRLQRTFEAKRAGETLSPEELISQLEALRANSPRFVDAYVFEAEVRQQRFKTGQDPADLDRAADLLQQAQQIAPADPRPLTGQFGVAMLRGQWERAEEALAGLERLQPGDPGILVRRARLLEKRGEGEKALARMREGVSRYPSWRNLFQAAQMESSHGHFDAARRDAEQLLANYPESYEGLTKLAEIEFLHGDLHRAVALYSRLVERYPRAGELANLGMAQMYLGSYREAETTFRKALALESGDVFNLLNLADTVTLAGRPEEGTTLYREVVSRARLDAADWQVLSARAQAQAHLKDSAGAVEAVQKMLRIGPEGAQIAYELSLTYTLLEDYKAALYNARGALQQGIAPRLFALPWFDPLRSNPSFAAELRSRSAS
ncbi:MAG TPA: protein kinase [Thermoanaerobaculia bacterium]|nr:protein kinase [Thermoanaerobaculia bacterium]